MWSSWRIERLRTLKKGQCLEMHLGKKKSMKEKVSHLLAWKRRIKMPAIPPRDDDGEDEVIDDAGVDDVDVDDVECNYNYLHPYNQVDI